jgi:hypothetical protein
MPSPAVIDVGQVAPSVTHLQLVTEGLRADLQDLRSVIRFVLPALCAVHDDPCKPAQRALLGDAIDQLTAAVSVNGSAS